MTHLMTTLPKIYWSRILKHKLYRRVFGDDLSAIKLHIQLYIKPVQIKCTAVLFLNK